MNNVEETRDIDLNNPTAQSSAAVRDWVRSWVMEQGGGLQTYLWSRRLQYSSCKDVRCLGGRGENDRERSSTPHISLKTLHSTVLVLGRASPCLALQPGQSSETSDKRDRVAMFRAVRSADVKRRSAGTPNIGSSSCRLVPTAGADSCIRRLVAEGGRRSVVPGRTWQPGNLLTTAYHLLPALTPNTIPKRLSYALCCRCEER